MLTAVAETVPFPGHTLAASLAENGYLVFAILGSALFWIALHYWNRYRDRLLIKSRRPSKLFLELCDAHRLTRPERSLLLRAAEMQPSQPAARAFVDPAILGRVAAASTADANAAQALLRQLFGGEQ